MWLGLLVTASLAANSLKLYTLQAGLNKILAFVPRLIVALVIVAAALAVGGLVAGFLRGGLARFARGAIVTLSVFMALDQLGIARNIVVTMFTVVLGAAAVAAAIAFGIGNIDLARQSTREWARRSRPDLVGAAPPAPAVPSAETPASTAHH
jgi:hypothetical protein